MNKHNMAIKAQGIIPANKLQEKTSQTKAA
jgi:hypothetical protein